MPDDARYAVKFDRLAGQTLLPWLDPTTRAFVREIAQAYRFSFQELRAVAQAARDLAMWCEEPLQSWWRRAEGDRRASSPSRHHKKALLASMNQHMHRLASQAKRYPEQGLCAPPRRQVRLVEGEAPRSVFGRCPAYSDRTVCCGLYTIDAVLGCPFDCSYCTIQTFYPDTAEHPQDLRQRLAQINLDPDRFYHLGSGQSSDSLAWANRGGILDALLELAERWPNALLELKTKSDHVQPLLDRAIPPNVVCSWTLNAETIVRNEEHNTASLAQRLDAARRVADRGVTVAFHIHPLVYFDPWQREYTDMTEQLLRRFTAEEVAFVSLGTMTFIKPVAQQIRRRGGQTKALQMEMGKDPHGKLTYPDPIKLALYRHLYGALQPWHARVFIYLCMEKASIWRELFGFSHASSEDFERAFGQWWQGYSHGGD